jgi:hypothetical protein
MRSIAGHWLAVYLFALILISGVWTGSPRLLPLVWLAIVALCALVVGTRSLWSFCPAIASNSRSVTSRSPQSRLSGDDLDARISVRWRSDSSQRSGPRSIRVLVVASVDRRDCGTGSRHSLAPHLTPALILLGAGAYVR